MAASHYATVYTTVWRFDCDMIFIKWSADGGDDGG